MLNNIILLSIIYYIMLGLSVHSLPEVFLGWWLVWLGPLYQQGRVMAAVMFAHSVCLHTQSAICFLHVASTILSLPLSLSLSLSVYESTLIQYTCTIACHACFYGKFWFSKVVYLSSLTTCVHVCQFPWGTDCHIISTHHWSISTYIQCLS